MLALGTFPYKPAPSPTRGGNDRMGRNWSPDVVLRDGEDRAVRGGQENRSARAQSLGVALIVEGDLDRGHHGAGRGRAGATADDPVTYNNLATAYLARARWFNRPEDWQKALDATDRALDGRK